MDRCVPTMAEELLICDEGQLPRIPRQLPWTASMWQLTSIACRLPNAPCDWSPPNTQLIQVAHIRHLVHVKDANSDALRCDSDDSVIRISSST